MEEPEMKTIKVVSTLYGLKGYIGSTREGEFPMDAEEFHATEWLSQHLATGAYLLSDKSCITLAQVQKHRATLGEKPLGE